ncbi:hypothetical protein J3459_015815 [Metarhizium acridum]|nr:hypothetical protein J3459_015815 [Metarhizium acridum]
MAATVRNIDWSPLQVTCSMLRSNYIHRTIVGEVALMHCGATTAFNPGFSIEICLADADVSKAVGILKSSRLFEDVPDHVITQSCHEGTVAYTRLQTVWDVSQPRNIILLPSSAFFNIWGLHGIANPRHQGTRLLGLSEEDMARIPLANLHELFVALVNRRVSKHDQLAALAAKRLFDTGQLNEQWLTEIQRTWVRRNYNLAMALIGKTVTTDEPIQVESNDGSSHEHATADNNNGRKRRMVILKMRTKCVKGEEDGSLSE